MANKWQEGVHEVASRLGKSGAEEVLQNLAGSAGKSLTTFEELARELGNLTQRSSAEQFLRCVGNLDENREWAKQVFPRLKFLQDSQIRLLLSRHTKSMSTKAAVLNITKTTGGAGRSALAKFEHLSRPFRQKAQERRMIHGGPGNSGRGFTYGRIVVRGGSC